MRRQEHGPTLTATAEARSMPTEKEQSIRVPTVPALPTLGVVVQNTPMCMAVRQRVNMGKVSNTQALMAGQPTAHQFLLHQRLITHIILLL